LNLFLSYLTKPIASDNPYPGPSTEKYGLWQVQLYIDWKPQALYDRHD